MTLAPEPIEVLSKDVKVDVVIALQQSFKLQVILYQIVIAHTIYTIIILRKRLIEIENIPVGISKPTNCGPQYGTEVKEKVNSTTDVRSISTT